MTDTLDFSTSRFPASERFGRYQDLYGNGADTVQTDSGFEAEIRGWRLDRLILFDRRVSGIAVERLAPRVRQDQFEHFTLQLNCRGELHGEGSDGFRAVKPGELLLMDMSKPMRTRMPDAHIITVSLARDLVEAAAKSIDSLHGRVLQAGPAGLLADFLVSLAGRAPTLADHAKPVAARMLVELLGVALGPERSSAEPARVQLDAIRLETARAFIETHLADEDLGPEKVAAATSLSRATLYRMFEEIGGVAKYTQGRRLARLRSFLGNPLEQKTFAALAHSAGFVSESHASRSFYNTYRVRPADFRQQVRRSVESDYGEEASIMKSRFVAWQAELR